MMGITITQVLRLERQLVTLPRFTYFILGKPLGLLFQVAAMTVALTGAYRFRRQQMSMERGKVWAGGWEIHLIMMFLFAVCSTSVNGTYFITTMKALTSINSL